MLRFENGTYYKNFLDTSAIVKLVKHPDIPEDGSDNLNRYYNEPGTKFHTIDLCLGEALGVLKADSKLGNRKKLTTEGYPMLINRLVHKIKRGKLTVHSIELADFMEDAFRIMTQAKIDFIDAVQIVFAQQDHKYLFISGDIDLCETAENNGLEVWNCSNEALPISNLVSYV